MHRNSRMRSCRRSTRERKKTTWYGEFFEVERILNHRWTHKTLEYLVRWKDYGPEDDSWIAEDDVSTALKEEYFIRCKEEEFEVEEIIGERVGIGGGKEFKVKWRGYGSQHDSWVLITDLHCPSLLQDFVNKKKLLQEVEAILEDIVGANGKKEYKVRWKTLGTIRETWVMENELKCHDLLREYLEKKEAQVVLNETSENAIKNEDINLDLFGLSDFQLNENMLQSFLPCLENPFLEDGSLDMESEQFNLLNNFDVGAIKSENTQYNQTDNALTNFGACSTQSSEQLVEYNPPCSLSQQTGNQNINPIIQPPSKLKSLLMPSPSSYPLQSPQVIQEQPSLLSSHSSVQTQNIADPNYSGANSMQLPSVTLHNSAVNSNLVQSINVRTSEAISDNAVTSANIKVQDCTDNNTLTSPTVINTISNTLPSTNMMSQSSVSNPTYSSNVFLQSSGMYNSSHSPNVVLHSLGIQYPVQSENMFSHSSSNQFFYHQSHNTVIPNSASQHLSQGTFVGSSHPPVLQDQCLNSVPYENMIHSKSSSEQQFHQDFKHSHPNLCKSRSNVITNLIGHNIHSENEMNNSAVEPLKLSQDLQYCSTQHASYANSNKQANSNEFLQNTFDTSIHHNKEQHNSYRPNAMEYKSSFNAQFTNSQNVQCVNSMYGSNQNSVIHNCHSDNNMTVNSASGQPLNQCTEHGGFIDQSYNNSGSQSSETNAFYYQNKFELQEGDAAAYNEKKQDKDMCESTAKRSFNSVNKKTSKITVLDFLIIPQSKPVTKSKPVKKVKKLNKAENSVTAASQLHCISSLTSEKTNVSQDTNSTSCIGDEVPHINKCHQDNMEKKLTENYGYNTNFSNYAVKRESVPLSTIGCGPSLGGPNNVHSVSDGTDTFMDNNNSSVNALPPKLNATVSADEPQIFRCNLCSYKSDKQRNLTAHRRVHTAVKKYLCRFCTYKTAYFNHLKEHECTHTGEKPIQCIYCPFRTAYRSTLRAHFKKHHV